MNKIARKGLVFYIVILIALVSTFATPHTVDEIYVDWINTQTGEPIVTTFSDVLRYFQTGQTPRVITESTMNEAHSHTGDTIFVNVRGQQTTLNEIMRQLANLYAELELINSAIQLETILDQEQIGTFFDAQRASMDLDSQNNPHVVLSNSLSAGDRVQLFSRLQNGWISQPQITSDNTLVGQPRLNPDWAFYIMRPRLVIDENDRGWISVWRAGDAEVERNEAGQPVNEFGEVETDPSQQKQTGRNSGATVLIQYDSLSTQPVQRTISSHRFASRRDDDMRGGVVALDFSFPNQAVLVGQDGHSIRVHADSGDEVSGSSALFSPGTSIEKINARISQVAGTSVYHIISGGFSGSHSGYQSNRRAIGGQQRVIYASADVYGDQRFDELIPGISGDMADPFIAYMAIHSDGAGDASRDSDKFTNKHLYVNIWDGSRLLFDSENLLRVDSDVMRINTMPHRADIQMAPAYGGGVWIAYANLNHEVNLVKISRNGRIIEPFVNQPNRRLVGSGRWATVATDEDGYVHVIWGDSSPGNMYYSKFADPTYTQINGQAPRVSDAIAQAQPTSPSVTVPIGGGSEQTT